MSRHFGFGFVRCLVVSQSGFPRLLRLRDLKSLCDIQLLCVRPFCSLICFVFSEILPMDLKDIV